MIIQYYADSLGLPRPNVVALNQRYIYLFEKWLKEKYAAEVFVIDRSKGGATIDSLFDQYKSDEDYFLQRKEVLILHFGICDCAPRPIPQSLRNLISLLPAFVRIRIVTFLHNHRARILRNGFVFYRTSKSYFEQNLQDWLGQAVSSFKVIYIFNIAPTNDETENHSPGLRKGIKEYNGIIHKVCEKVGTDRIKILDVHEMISTSDLPLDELILKEDGHHITAKAHQFFANKLIDSYKSLEVK